MSAEHIVTVEVLPPPEKKRKKTGPKPKKPRPVGSPGPSAPPISAKNEHRQWTKEERLCAIMAVRANNGSVSLTSQQLGIPYDTLRYWVKNLSVADDPDYVKQYRELFQNDLAAAIEDVAWKIAGSLAANLGESSMKDRVAALSTIIDKTRLLRGQATSIAGKEEMTDDDKLRRVRELIELAKSRRASSPDVIESGGAGRTLPVVSTLPGPVEGNSPR